MTAPPETRPPWYQRFAGSVGEAWAWARRKHLPGLLSVATLALLLVAERRLLKEVLHAQEGLKDALADLKLTVNDELGAAQSALQDTRILENDIRSRLDALHGKELTDVPELARALKDELDAGVGRARGVAWALGAPGPRRGAPETRSVTGELESLSAQLAEVRRLAVELGERAQEADEALGGLRDGGVAPFPDVRARASRVADRLSEAESVMFAREALAPETAQVGVAKGNPPGRSPADVFPPLYAKARDLSLALDRTSARLFGDGGLQDGAELGRKLRDIQAHLQAFQARVDRLDEALRAQEASLQRSAVAPDGGPPDTGTSTAH
jgi:hypothetical protein